MGKAFPSGDGGTAYAVTDEAAPLAAHGEGMPSPYKIKIGVSL